MSTLQRTRITRSAFLRRSRSAKALLASLATITALSVAPTSASALAPATFIAITCKTSGGTINLSYKANGVDYPKSVDIKVVTQRYQGDLLVARHETTLRTSSTGSWSTPTYSGTAPAGTYPLVYVATQRAPSGAFIDDAQDQC